MKKDILKLNLLAFLICIFYKPAFAWDDKITHKDLSQYGAESSILRPCKTEQDQNCDYLINLGFSNGLLEILKWTESSTIKQGKVEDWIREGGELEDYSTRWRNHFHNPLKPWLDLKKWIRHTKWYTRQAVRLIPFNLL